MADFVIFYTWHGPTDAGPGCDTERRSVLLRGCGTPAEAQQRFKKMVQDAPHPHWYGEGTYPQELLSVADTRKRYGRG